MKYSVRISAEADRQLFESAKWYATQDREVGETWYNGFKTAIASLAENPQRCGLAHENEAFPFQIFALHYGSGRRKTHRAVFRVDGQTVEVVEVLAIRHHAQRDLHPEDIPSADKPGRSVT